MSPRGLRIALATGAALAALLVLPYARALWLERGAVREFQQAVLNLEIARQDRLYTGISPLDKGRTPMMDVALRQWVFHSTHALVKARRASPAPGFRKYMALLDGVFERSLRLGEQVGRLAEIDHGISQLTVVDLADPERAKAALRAFHEARAITRELRPMLEQHHEYARGAVRHSGLSDEARAAVWRAADDAYVTQLAIVASVEQAEPERAKRERMVRFLDEHRRAYTVDPRFGLVFHDRLVGIEYQRLNRRLRQGL